MKYRSLDLIPATGVSHNPEISKKVLIDKEEIPHITQFAKVTLTPGQIADVHQHLNMYEIFNTESGKGKILVEDSEYQLTAGVCVVVEPSEKHEVQNTGKEDLTLTIIGIEV